MVCGMSQLAQVHNVSGNACFWDSCGNSLLLEKLVSKYWNFKLFSFFNLSSNTHITLFLVFNKQFSIFDMTLFTYQQGWAQKHICWFDFSDRGCSIDAFWFLFTSPGFWGSCSQLHSSRLPSFPLFLFSFLFRLIVLSGNIISLQ